MVRKEVILMYLLFRLKKIKSIFFYILSLLCFITSTSYGADTFSTPLKFVVPDFPPFTYKLNGQLSGVGVDKIKKIMALSHINYTVQIVKDYKVAMLLMQQGKVDGIFLASENKERSDIATFSKPIMINRWCWYFKAGSGLTPLKRRFKRNAKVGTILNTNTQQWLQQNDYSIVGKPNNATALNKMLLANRVNAVFVAEAAFETILSKDQYYLYHKMIEVEKPFGLYISNTYIDIHPHVITKINEAITQLITQKKL